MAAPVTPEPKKRVRPFPFADLPRLLRAQVDAGRTLLAHLPIEAGPDWPDACRALGGPVDLELTEAYALPARELHAQARGTVLRLAAPGGRWGLLVLDGRLAPRLARRALGTDGAAAAELPAPRPLTVAEEGAIEFLVAALIDSLPLRTDGVLADVELQQIIESLGTEGWLYALSVRVIAPVGAGWARFLCPESLRLAFPTPTSAAALLRRKDRLAEAQVGLHLEVGRMQVARADFAQLAAGDVVLFDHLVRDARGGEVTLRLGRGGFRARLDGDALTIEANFHLNLGAPTMDHETQKADGAGADPLLRELPVEVACELGRVTMSGRELLELRPGAVIPVGRPLAGPVDLTVGGRVVARGELVDVEGEIGVRITQMCD